MPIKIRCACGNIILAPEERVGQTGNCPSCNRAITVELPDVEPKSQSKQKGKLRLKKSSLIMRLFSMLIYLVFLILAGGTIGLHWAGTEAISQFQIKRPHWLKVFWETNKNMVLTVRSDQRKWYHAIIGAEFPSKDNSALKKNDRHNSIESIPNTTAPSILEKKSEQPKTEQPKTEQPKTEQPKTEQPKTGNGE